MKVIQYPIPMCSFDPLHSWLTPSNHPAHAVLVPVERMEHQSSDFDALPRRHIRTSVRVFKRRVWNASSSSILLAVKALDEQDLVRGKPVLVVPLVRGVVLDGERLPLSGRVNQAYRLQVVLRHRPGVCHG